MKSLSIRMFIHNKKEVIEITSKDMSTKEILTTERITFDLGQSLCDFLYGEFGQAYDMLRETQQLLRDIRSSKDIVKNWDKMIHIAEELPNNHVYFAVVQKAIYDLYVNEDERKKRNEILNVKLFSDMWGHLDDEKERIKTIFSECLDVDNPSASSISQRYWIAAKRNNYRKIYFDRISVSTEIMPIDDPETESHNMAQTLTTDTRMAFYDVCYPQNIFELIDYHKAYLLKNEIGCRVCKSCGRYFALTGNSNAEYCNRLIEGSTKTCREVGAVRAYQKKKFDNPAVKAYNKAYKKRNARIRYGRMTKEDFAEWAVEARKMRDMCVAGDIDLEALEMWFEID